MTSSAGWFKDDRALIDCSTEIEELTPNQFKLEATREQWEPREQFQERYPDTSFILEFVTFTLQFWTALVDLAFLIVTVIVVLNITHLAPATIAITRQNALASTVTTVIISILAIVLTFITHRMGKRF